MLRVFQFILKAIIILVRVYRWLQRMKRKIVSWFSGKSPNTTGQHSKTTIIHSSDSPTTQKRKVFGSDEGEYVDFREV